MLKLNEVSIRFGGLIAVNNLNLHVEKNEIVGLIGPNGAGKTTAFNIISAIYRPTHGEIYFKNERIDHLARHMVTGKGIARTYQNINLFHNMTVLENVQIGCHTKSNTSMMSSLLRLPSEKREESAILKKSIELLEFVGIRDKYSLKSSSLSYGDQRRLEIARALASEPELLLLDEPAAGMNSSEKESLRQLISLIRDTGVTVLIVEHDMKLIMRITDRIYVLNYGAKIAEGLPEEIVTNPEVIKAYLGGARLGNKKFNA